MKFYIIAGEASGDLHGAGLMKGLLARDPACEIRFWGGDRMREAGGTMVRHYREGAVMGALELLSSAGRLLGRLRFCKQDILNHRPDAVILVDYPGFNLKIARFAHRKGIKVYYYIAPKLWAHGSGRIRKLRRSVDRLFVIFPFEVEYFRTRGIKAEYYGNPLVDSFPSPGDCSDKSIALLAGSRKAEISRLLPRYAELETLIASDSRFDGYRLLLAGAPSMTAADYSQYLPETSGIELSFGRTGEMLRSSSAAVVANGTANLEAALAGIPQVSCYAMNPATFAIARAVVRIPLVSLPNILLEEECVKELIQKDASAQNIYKELCSLLFDPGRRGRMLKGYGRLREMLGGEGASFRTAAAMLEDFEDNN